MASIMNFDWTAHASTAYRAAANPDKPVPGRVSPNASLLAASGTKGTASGGLDGGKKDQNGANGPPRKLSSPMKLRSAISAKFGTGRVVPLDAAETGGRSQMQRRMTHAGVVESGEKPLGMNVLHFTPQEFMDPDTAAAQVCAMLAVDG